MHVAMVFKDGEKMSKSLGNLVFVDALRTEWDPRAIRLTIISHHYRKEWEWNEHLMPASDTRLRSWRETLSAGSDDTALLQAVRTHLDNDLDTPGALSAIDDAARAGVAVSRAAALLGVDLEEIIGPR
jgi:L-cysteine:1D-myo-inositol 2-amino-2-deoxy-alpha-D-glucopyranoside ligase